MLSKTILLPIGDPEAQEVIYSMIKRAVKECMQEATAPVVSSTIERDYYWKEEAMEFLGLTERQLNSAKKDGLEYDGRTKPHKYPKVACESYRDRDAA